MEQSSDDILLRYERAQCLEQGILTKSIVRNVQVCPHWVGGGKYFWYERQKENGQEYRLVDIEAEKNVLAFDHVTLATLLSDASGESVDAENLPVQDVEINLSPKTVCFTAFDGCWIYKENLRSCKKVRDHSADWVISPDGKQAAFKRDHNIWLRDIATGDERELTFDGEKFYAYGSGPTVWGCDLAPTLQALWSPDSTQLLTVQIDMRRVRSTPVLHHLPDDGDLRPAVMEYKSALPGDKNIEEYHVLAIEVRSGKIQKANFRAVPPCREALGFFDEQLGWWGNNSRRAFFIAPERGEQIFQVVEFDTLSGATRVLIEEKSDTYVRLEPNIVINPPIYAYIPEADELIWWSESSGWGHLYLYDLNTGGLKHQITTGDDWLVRGILHVDYKRREIFIQSAGRDAERDPYHRDICRVCIDTGDIKTLVSSNHDYSCEGSPQPVSVDCNYFVATRSRVDELPSSIVMDREGAKLFEIENPDSSSIPADFKWPEPVKLLSADGVTNIYGTVYYPSNFSPDKKYPIVDFCYNAPYHAFAAKTAMVGWDNIKFLWPAALAQLGFIVVVIDGRGTALRSKEFQDEGYGWLPSCSNLEDHVAGIRQLEKRFSFIDINRVGIVSYGYSSGVPHALFEYPDFFKLGAVYGLEDCRFMASVFGEKYEGLLGPSKDRIYYDELVKNFKGKLFLAHGLLDRCVPPAAMFKLIDALQKANKDFDMLMLPNAGHPTPSYVVRRMWDYLVVHLLDEQPPKEFNFASTYEPAMLGGYYQEELVFERKISG